MPYQIHFENEGRGVVLEFSGDVSGEDILAATRVMYAEDDAHRLRYQLVDLLEVTALAIADHELRAIALLDHQASLRNPRQVVALVGAEEMFEGGDRRYAIYAEVWAGFKSQMFASMPEARRWLAEVVPALPIA
jgi:hypothetical protein